MDGQDTVQGDSEQLRKHNIEGGRDFLQSLAPLHRQRS